jgi:osmotically-inducible protein OsmY
MPDDSTLQAMVMEELDWEPSLDAAHIGVSAKSGVITLSGFVDSFAAKEAAENAASRVKGVKAIAEELEVRLPNTQRHADDEIAERAVKILAWDVKVPHEDIQVKVEHGVVSLSGTVSHQFQKAEAETDIRRLGGVRGVLNHIEVRREYRISADPEMVKQRIETALRRNAEIEASHIEVNIEDGKVMLRGNVRTWLERRVAENAAWAAPGVADVRDELKVQP